MEQGDTSVCNTLSRETRQCARHGPGRNISRQYTEQGNTSVGNTLSRETHQQAINTLSRETYQQAVH